MNITPHLIDLTRYAWRRERRGFAVYGTWLFRATVGERPEPCIVIVPQRAVSHERTTPAVIPLRNAWIWSEEAGDPRHAARSSATMLAAMDVPVSSLACIGFTILVRDHLGDLQHIPPYAGDTTVVADAVRTDQYGRQQHAEIRERV